MSIKVEPSKILSRLASSRKIKKVLGAKGVSLKRSALLFIQEIEFVDAKRVTEVALKVVKQYKIRIKDDKDAKKDIRKDPKLLISRIQNEVVTQMTEGIREKYTGDKYRWLPSDAEEPDPEHQLNYGKIFTIGSGEMPGDRYGCKCGMEILVNETELQI